MSQGKQKDYLVPKDFSPHVLVFHDKCFGEWEGSDCEKNYDKNRLAAFKKEIAKQNDEDKEWMKNEVKEIKTKWNIKDQPQERERERAELPNWNLKSSN